MIFYVFINDVRQINNYWEHVRDQYVAFESGSSAPASEVYLHEMPGGQFTNLKTQARSLGLEEQWPEIARIASNFTILWQHRYFCLKLSFPKILSESKECSIEGAFENSIDRSGRSIDSSESRPRPREKKYSNTFNHQS